SPSSHAHTAPAVPTAPTADGEAGLQSASRADAAPYMPAWQLSPPSYLPIDGVLLIASERASTSERYRATTQSRLPQTTGGYARGANLVPRSPSRLPELQTQASLAERSC